MKPFFPSPRHLAILACASLLFYSTAPKGPTVITEELLIVDKKGRRRMALTAQDDRVDLTLFDHNGKKRSGIAVDSKGDPLFYLCDENGTPRVRMYATDSGRHIQFSSKDGADVINIGDANDSAGLALHRAGIARPVLYLSAGEFGSDIHLADAKGVERVLLGTSLRREAGVTISDSSGKSRLALHCSESEQVMLEAIDDSGKTRFVLRQAARDAATTEWLTADGSRLLLLPERK